MKRISRKKPSPKQTITAMTKRVQQQRAAKSRKANSISRKIKKIEKILADTIGEEKAHKMMSELVESLKSKESTNETSRSYSSSSRDCGGRGDTYSQPAACEHTTYEHIRGPSGLY